MNNSKTKIVFFPGRLIMGGLEMVLKNLLDELKKRDDLELVVFANVKEKYFRDWFDANKDKIKLYNGRLWIKPKPKIIRTLRCMRTRAKVMSVISNADIVIDFRNGESYELLKDFAGKKIVWIHGGFNQTLDIQNMKDILSYDKIVCLTEAFKNDFIAAFPQYAEKIVRIYNAIPYEEIAKKSKNATIPKGKYFISVMRVTGDKDIITVLLGFDKFWRENGRPDVRLYFIGGGDNYGKKDRMELLTAELESCNNIIFAGNVPEPFGYMRGSLANILSSKSEGMAVVLAEAIACNTINIASDCKSGPREILMDGEAGLLFPVEDDVRLSKLMADVYHGHINRGNLIANGTAGLVRFSAQKNAEAVIELIRGLS